MLSNHFFHNANISCRCFDLADAIGITAVCGSIAGFNILQSWQSIIFKQQLDIFCPIFQGL